MSFKLQSSPQLLEVLHRMTMEDRWHERCEPRDLPDWSEGLSKIAKKLDRGTGGNAHLSAILGLQVFMRRLGDNWSGKVNPRLWVFLRNSRVDPNWRDVQCAMEGLPCTAAAQLAFGEANKDITREWLRNLRAYLQDGTPMPEIVGVTYDGRKHPTNLPRLAPPLPTSTYGTPNT